MTRTEFLNRPTTRVFLVPFTIVVLSLLLFAGWIFFWPNTFPEPKERLIIVSRGATFASVVDSLKNKEIISSPMAFRLAGRLLGWAKEMQVGKYYFSSGASNLSILSGMHDGSSRRLALVSIPEGLRARTIAQRFAIEVGIDAEKFLSLCFDSTFVQQFWLPGKNLEGYLLPNTYGFHWQTDEREIVTKLVEGFKEFYVDSLVERSKEMKMTMVEVVALASIVEGEAQRGDERAIIAGVYHNRLKKRMRLEADPTVQYVLPDGPRRLLYQDLKVPSPYNTYLHYGLPPGPISNPGRDAILAVLYPAQHDFLFFVADGKGGHYFSRSYSEHQRAVRAYRRARRELQRTANLGG